MDLWSRRKFFFTTLTASALASASPVRKILAGARTRRAHGRGGGVQRNAAGDHLFGERR